MINGAITLVVCPVLLQKPVSLYSDDPTDFSEQKYMTIRTEYFLEKDGVRREISEEEAQEFIKKMESGKK